MTAILDLAELDREIFEIRANLRDLVEQETARSGARDDIQDDDLIAGQEEKLKLLSARRDELARLSAALRRPT